MKFLSGFKAISMTGDYEPPENQEFNKRVQFNHRFKIPNWYGWPFDTPEPNFRQIRKVMRIAKKFQTINSNL